LCSRMSRSSDSPPLTGKRRERLLLVDDELSTVFAMREYFALAGFDVDCAAGIKDTSVLLERSAYTAVITDLHLSPQRCGEGLLVAEHIRQRNVHAVIVMLTGYGSDATAVQAERCGVDLYQTKPVALSVLRDFIERTTAARNGAAAEGDLR
jgi:ActR/RegA family two-component response regulator